MLEHVTKKYSNYIIAALLIVFGLLALFLRLIPLSIGNTSDILSMVGMDDPMYHLRQIEQMMHNYPNYCWFDAMTYYPHGNPIHWGPLFTLIATTFCMLLGATTRAEMIPVALLVAPLMAVAMVPVIYLLTEKIGNWKIALIAAFLIAIVPGQYFYRSYYGYLDHHIAEVLFSTIFCLCYIVTLQYVRKNPINLRDYESLKKPVLLSLITGFAYTLGLAIMPTMILFALIVAVFTVVHFILANHRGECGESVLLINTATFFTAFIGFFVIGIHYDGLLLNYYTISHPIAYLMLIAGTFVLYGVSKQLKEKPVYWYILSLIGISVLGFAALAIFSPQFYSLLTSGLAAFFGTNAYYQTIQEARAWSLGTAWKTFSYGLVTLAGGFAVLLYRFWKQNRSEDLFVFVWSLFIVYAAFQHIRYEYYFAVPVVVLTSLFIGFLGIRAFKKSEPEGQNKTEKGKKSLIQALHLPKLVFIFVICLTLVFGYTALQDEFSIGVLHLNGDWRESLDWLGENTPDTGVDYYKIYDEKSWVPPEESYGVMSWWDYGHMTTFIAKRMPNANPFQYGVAGENGAAAFFMAKTEEGASEILDNLGTKYVITDAEMDTGKFWAMATWDSATEGIKPYMQEFLIPEQDNPKSATLSMLYLDGYYNTMISRLHNFDGSQKTPDSVYYIEYIKPEASGLEYPLVLTGIVLPPDEANNRVESFKKQAPSGYDATVVNYDFTIPAQPVPALTKFRLVHESPTRITPAGMTDVRYVKVFEYVKGAKIKGEGVIEIPLVTNQGRKFMYTQESIDGEFVVPYSTEENSGSVKPLGKYLNKVTGEEYTVTETQVQNGMRVN